MMDVVRPVSAEDLELQGQTRESRQCWSGNSTQIGLKSENQDLTCYQFDSSSLVWT